MSSEHTLPLFLEYARIAHLDPSHSLYPAVVTDTIPDMVPPAPYLDNIRLPFDSTDAR